MSKKTPMKLALFLSLAAALASNEARAEEMIIKDASVHDTRPSKLDLTGSFGFFGDTQVGVAGWFSFPIVNDGFIPPLNDSFNLEFGAALDYSWINYGGFASSCDFNYYGFAPMGGVRWDLYLTQKWTVFAKGKLGIGYHFGSTDCGAYKINDDVYSTTFLASDFGAGAYWNFAENMGMRFELGYRGGSVGISWNM